MKLDIIPAFRYLKNKIRTHYIITRLPLRADDLSVVEMSIIAIIIIISELRGDYGYFFFLNYNLYVRELVSLLVTYQPSIIYEICSGALITTMDLYHFLVMMYDNYVVKYFELLNNVMFNKTLGFVIFGFKYGVTSVFLMLLYKYTSISTTRTSNLVNCVYQKNKNITMC